MSDLNIESSAGDENNGESEASLPVSFEVWLYHPDIMSKIGEYAYLHGHLHVITKDGLEPVNHLP